MNGAVGEAKTESGKTVSGNFIPLREVATKVGVHHSTILNWIKKNKVKVKPYKNSRGHWVFRENDISKFHDYHISVVEAT